MGEKNIIVVGLSDCKPCLDLQEQLKKEDVAKQLSEKYGVDASKVRVLYADADDASGDEARNICYSVDQFSSPQLIIEEVDEGKRRLCTLDDSLEKKKCAEFKSLPM